MEQSQLVRSITSKVYKASLQEKTSRAYELPVIDGGKRGGGPKQKLGASFHA